MTHKKVTHYDQLGSFQESKIDFSAKNQSILKPLHSQN